MILKTIFANFSSFMFFYLRIFIVWKGKVPGLNGEGALAEGKTEVAQLVQKTTQRLEVNFVVLLFTM